jgi:hypothetical protein
MLRILLLVGLLSSLSISTIAQEDDPTRLLQDQDYYVEVFVSNRTPYVGEVITYTIRYYSIDPPPYRYDLPNFEDFWIASAPYSNDTVTNYELRTIGNRQFYVGDLIAEIAPVTSGNVQIQPGQFGIEESVFLDEVSLTTEALTLDVQAIPSNDAPPDFNGAVGQYNANATFSPLEIVLGEPVTLQVSIEGLGNFDLLPPPALPETVDWQIYRQPARYQASEASGLRFGRKVFEWLLIPRSAGTQTFPSFDFVHFDPMTENYQTIRFAEQPIDVFPGDDIDQRLSYRPEAAAQEVEVPPLATIRLPAGDTDANDMLLWLLWGVPPIILFGGVAYRTGISYLQSRRRQQRYRNALKRLADRLQATQSLSPEASSYQFEAAIYQYIQDKNGDTQVSTTAEAVAILRKHHIDPTTFTAALDAAIDLRYVLVSSMPDVARTGQQIYRQFKELDAQWSNVE